MSLLAQSWVLYDAEIEDHADFRLLMALADRASDDGTGAYPSVKTLALRMRRSERSVQRGLRKLLADGWIRLGDQQLVAHIRADQRPTVYDLVMDRGQAVEGESQPPSGVTQHVTSCPSCGVTPDVTPSDERGDIHGPNGVTSGVTQTIPSLLRNETVQTNDLAQDAQSTPRRLAPKSDDPDGFIEFWAAYPMRKSRGAAVKAYVSARKKATHEEILDGVRRYVAENPHRLPRYTAYPAKWLKDERWTDEPAAGSCPADQESDEDMTARLTRMYQETLL